MQQQDFITKTTTIKRGQWFRVKYRTDCGNGLSKETEMVSQFRKGNNSPRFTSVAPYLFQTSKSTIVYLNITQVKNHKPKVKYFINGVETDKATFDTMVVKKPSAPTTVFCKRLEDILEIGY